MKKGRIRKAAWYPMAVAICIGVVLYIVLSNFSGILAWIRGFFGHFRPVIWGCVIAYIVNPLARLFERIFGRVKKTGTRRFLANGAAFIVVLLFLTFTVWILIPQIIKSVENFIANLDGYVASIDAMLERWGVTKSQFDLSSFISSSESLLSSVSAFVSENMGNILSASASVGGSVFRWVIAFILAIYLLSEKPKLQRGMRRLLRAVFGEERYRNDVRIFLHKCDTICNRYIVYNLIDSLIVGLVNAVFTTVCGMQYVGLIAFVTAFSNLIPTFGPVVGAVIGGFVLLMVNPTHALIFLIFTLILQICDAYVIKPRLFGNPLGISGLWVLIGVIVGGNMFGVIGILLAIPGVAILDFLYLTYLVPKLEDRWKEKAEEPPRQEAEGRK